MNSIYKLIIVTILLSVVYCLALEEDLKDTLHLKRTSSNLLLNNEARRKKKDHYFLYPYYGWHALTWIYWIKVKLVVVAFFAYTAFIWALRYMGSYYDNCSHAGHHVYYGHYRSFPQNQIPTSIQKFEKNIGRRKRFTNNTK